jgi:dolichol kinase
MHAAAAPRPANLTRAFFHLCGATTGILILHFIEDRALVLGVAVAVAVAAWAMEISRRRSAAVNDWLMWLFGKVAHPHEREHVNSATWYATALVILAGCFSPLANAIGLAVLGVADPVAGMVGRRWGSWRLRSGRSVQGSLGFVVAGALAAFGAARVLYPEVAWTVALLAALAGAVAGAVAERVSTRFDDNFSIPVVSAAFASLALLMSGAGGASGWSLLG